MVILILLGTIKCFIVKLLRSHNNNGSTHSIAPPQFAFLHYVFLADLVVMAISGIDPPQQSINLPALESAHIMLDVIMTDPLTFHGHINELLSQPV